MITLGNYLKLFWVESTTDSNTHIQIRENKSDSSEVIFDGTLEGAWNEFHHSMKGVDFVNVDFDRKIIGIIVYDYFS